MVHERLFLDGGYYLDTESGDILLDSDGVDDLPEDFPEHPRYLRVDPIESDEGYELMKAFVATVTDDKVAERLASALGGAKPFRRFKDALLDFPEWREAWFTYEQDAHGKLALTWCTDQGIEPEWV